MKNKLTSEEKILQSKLDEASFEYNAANWSELQGSLGKKGFLSNFSPFVKATIGLIVLTGAVFTINNLYQTEEKSSPITEETVSTNENKTEASKEESPSLVEDKVENTAVINESNSINTHNVVSTPVKEDKAKQLVEEKSILNNDENSKQDKEKVQETLIESTNSEYVTIHAINILSPTCIQSDLAIEADVSKNVQEDLYYQWLINGKMIDRYYPKIEYRFNEAGTHSISLIVSYEGNKLAEFSRYITIPPSSNLDFIATDLTDVFYDQNINVKVLNPNEGEYRWLNEHKTVHFGEEAVFSFLDEGRHTIQLEHTSEEGCISTTEKEVYMKKDFIAAFPNAFTPDNDGDNDEFVLKVLQLPDTKFELIIVDISGKPVFTSKDAYRGWNGRINNTGAQLTKGTFAWTAVIENKNGHRKTFRDKVKINPPGIK